MNRVEDLRGRTFGKLTVFDRAGVASDGSALWLCRCVCGSERVSISRKLRLGDVRSCKRCREIVGGWTTQEEARLCDLYPLTDTSELAKLFGRSVKAIASRAKILKLAKAIGHGGKVHWTPALDLKIRALYPDTHTDELARNLNVTILALYNRATKLRIRKSDAYLAAKKADEAERLKASGVAHRFHKGQAPVNKGLRRSGWHVGRMRETQFRKGQSPRNTMPLWSFRWVDGYLALKTGKPGAKPMDGWEYVHKLIWEQHHGPLPDWRVARLWWKDGDHSNNSLSNLELVSAAEHMARTTIHNLPAPLPELFQLTGALKRKIRNKEKKRNGQEHTAGSQGPSVCDTGVAV